jgi:predicted ATPase/DNA-binding CsgD family transcriptional regulator
MLYQSAIRNPQRVLEPRTRLIGRADLVATFLSMLSAADRPVVTITGPGGVGKTRLALRLASVAREHFRDGVIFVPLAPVRGEGAVLRALAQAVDLRDDADTPLFDALVRSLRDLDILLILDNFEHVLPDAAVVDRLIQANPSVRVLVTSQSRLELESERVCVLQPLTVPPAAGWALERLEQVEAIQLFVDRARALQPEFALTPESAPHVVEICRSLDGLPLAIELAAARINVLPISTLQQRISGSLFETLRSDRPDVAERHRALHATIAWSYGLLDATGQRLLTRLSVFVGGFPLSAVGDVWRPADGEHDDPERNLFSLVEKNFIRLLGEIAGEPRYAMLEMIRRFALERLEGSSREEARAVHAAWCLQLVGQPDHGLDQAAHAAWVDRLTAEQDNLRSALRWSIRHDPATALRLVNGLWLFWYVRGHLSEGRQWLMEAVRVGESATPDIRALAMNNLGNLHYELGELDLAASSYEESLRLWREAGDEVGAADVLNNLGMLATSRGDVRKARALLTESLEEHRRLRDFPGVAPTLNNLGDLAIAEGDGAAAWRWNKEALGLSLELGSSRRVAHSTLNMGVAQRCLGNDEAAIPLLERSLAMFQDARDLSGIAIALQQLARVAISRGDRTSAGERLSRALALHRRGLDRRGLVLCLQSAALIAATAGRWQQCATLLGAADRLRGHLRPLQPPLDSSEIDAVVESARSALGDAPYASARVAGETMSRDDVISLAMSVLSAPPTPETILTRRELQVLRMIAEGASNSDIADALFITLRTVKAHVTNIFTKLGLSSRAAVVAYAYQHDLI